MKAKTVLTLVIAGFMLLMILPAAVSATMYELQNNVITLPEGVTIGITPEQRGADLMNDIRAVHYPTTGTVVKVNNFAFGWEVHLLDYVWRDVAWACLTRWPGYPSYVALPTWDYLFRGSPCYEMNWNGITLSAPYWCPFGHYGFPPGWTTRDCVWGMGAGPIHGPFPNGQYVMRHQSTPMIGQVQWWGSIWYIGSYYYCGYDYFEVQAGIEANITFLPETLNLGSEGTWIKCMIEFPVPDLDVVHNIDISTIKINNAVAAEANAKYGFVANPVFQTGQSGYDELMVKVDRDAVCALIGTAQEADVRVNGYTTNNIAFYGTGTIHAIKYYDHPK
jgi:hypothetical protein